MSKPTFPTDQELENINNEERRIVCRYLKILCTRKQKPLALNAIRQKIKPNIQAWKNTSNSTLDSLFTRILDPTRYSTKDSIGEAKVSFFDLKLALEEAYPDQLKETATYLFYYWSDESIVRPAVLIFNIEERDWGSGRLKYYDVRNSEFIEKREDFILNRLTPKSGPKDNKTIYYSAMRDNDHYTLLSIFVDNYDLQDRNVMFTAYSVSKGKENTISAGIGLLVKEENNYQEKINSISQFGIEKEIINVLYNRRETVNENHRKVFEKIEDINKDYLSELAGISGYWIGYMYRRDITNTNNPTQKENGIKILLLKIEENGEAHIFNEVNAKVIENQNSNYLEVVNTGYKGFIRFPEETEYIVKISLSKKKLSEKHNYRYQLTLKIFKEPGTTNIMRLRGIIAGLTTSDNIPFASPIYFERFISVTISDKSTYAENKKEELVAVLKRVKLGNCSWSNLKQIGIEERQKTFNTTDLASLDKAGDDFITSVKGKLRNIFEGMFYSDLPK